MPATRYRRQAKPSMESRPRFLIVVCALGLAATGCSGGSSTPDLSDVPGFAPGTCMEPYVLSYRGRHAVHVPSCRFSRAWRAQASHRAGSSTVELSHLRGRWGRPLRRLPSLLFRVGQHPGGDQLVRLGRLALRGHGAWWWERVAVDVLAARSLPRVSDGPERIRIAARGGEWWTSRCAGT